MKTIDLEKYLIRSFSPDHDFPQLATLYATVEAVDQDGLQISEQNLRAQSELPGYDPAMNRFVVEAADESHSLVASGVVSIASGSDLAEANILVDPAWRRRGIGSALLSKVIDRTHQLEAIAVQIYTNARHPAGSGFLQQHGFVYQGAYTELRLSEGVRLPPVIWPFGYTVRPYVEVQDLSVLTEAMNLCYIPLWGHHEASENQMASWLPDFNQQGLFLVYSEKVRVIGISRVEPSPERTRKNGVPTGYIDAPGIVPQHRRLDLYRALVLTGIRWLLEQGQTLIEMESWGDKLEVLKMYRELGFKDIRQLLCYKIDLSPDD
jgi:mycothiol synthase